MAKEDKLKALDAAIAQIEKQYGKGAVMKLGDPSAQMNVETIPTGSLSLDLALGLGGIPKGRIIEIYGPESSGKTPPELGADIYRHGIYLTGGASQISHLAALMQKGTGLKVNLADNPIESVARGLAKVIKDDNYKSVAYSIEGMGR